MSVLDKLIGMLAPHGCLVCGREGRLVCLWCQADSFNHLPSRCYRCHAMTEDHAVCRGCRRISPLKHVWVRCDYDDLAKALVRKYKFQHARAAADDIAKLMAQDLPYFADALIVPLPTASRRVRQRGFDHTLLLAKSLSQILKIDWAPYLIRLGQSQQVGTKRSQRIKQVQGAFLASGNISGQEILLIDDVTTTGASLEEAARVLRKAGAKRVNAAVFAQAK
ncbi:MAG: ComF family protein [Candidatus Saccharimonadales bacterium]